MGKLARWGFAIVFAASLAGPPSSRALDVFLPGYKLVIIDKLMSVGKARVTLVSRDEFLTATKGAGTDPADLSATLEIAYADAYGVFDMPQGSRWLVNTEEFAKYADSSAPTTGSVKVARIEPGSAVKIVARSLGETPLDVSTPIDGAVFAALTLTNGAETFRECAQFNHCVQKSIAGGTGTKLSCKNTFPLWDYNCRATTPTCLVDRYVDLGATVQDSCTGLEWEKKDAYDGDDDAVNLHDADNSYVWAGHCSISPTYCQPSAAAEAACRAQTDPSDWAIGCNQCGALDGSCIVTNPCSVVQSDPITTVWEWAAQLNAAAFAGHTDWRLPTSGGPPYELTGEPREIESLVDSMYGVCFAFPCEFGCGAEPCINPVFGPTRGNGDYWSATTGADPETAIQLFNELDVAPFATKACNANVRAVRTTP